jgi:hypothetical protein
MPRMASLSVPADSPLTAGADQSHRRGGPAAMGSDGLGCSAPQRAAPSPAPKAENRSPTLYGHLMCRRNQCPSTGRGDSNCARGDIDQAVATRTKLTGFLVAMVQGTPHAATLHRVGLTSSRAYKLPWFDGHACKQEH